jgi:hypothetical protein
VILEYAQHGNWTIFLSGKSDIHFFENIFSVT